MRALFPRCEPPPEALPETLELLVARDHLGADANGSALLSDLRAYLDEVGIDDAGERDAWRTWIRALDAEAARFRAAQIAAATAASRRRS